VQPIQAPATLPPEQQPEAHLRSLRQGLRVLVVDDQYVNRTVTRALLRELGFTPETVDSGEAALAVLAQQQYDAVLLDCQMPGLDGFETCRRLRQQEDGGRHTPVIAVTADTLVDDRRRCAEAGMDDHLAKPLWSADLAAVLDRHLGTMSRRPARDELVQERLDGLGRIGDGSLKDDVVRAFLKQGEHDLKVLRSALPENDADAFADAAHALSGSSGILGGQTLAGIAGELASLARQGDLGACAARLPALERELAAFVAELSE
jgi:CheY-like chemotaxis protein/HPt (histidine-containing phosphotransfer) domain-containing protein